MKLDRIGGMTQGDLRRFIVNLLQSDPGALPRHLSSNEMLPSSPHIDGDVPVWNAGSNTWVPSSQHKISGGQLNWSIGTAPPNSPSAGDLWAYSGTGFYWLFIYDTAEATNKWKFIGGPPIIGSGGSINTNSITYVDITGGGTITVPRSGDYTVRGKCRAAVQVATLTDAFVQLTFTTLGAGPAGSVTLPNVQFSADDPAAEGSVTGLTAGETCKLQVRCGQANNVIFSEAVFSLLPRRVI